MIGTLIKRVGKQILGSRDDADLKAYLRNGRRPWSRGYDVFKRRFLRVCLRDDDLMERFAAGADLPVGFGEFLDERVVEYPWLMSRLCATRRRLLDAGSVLNHVELLDQSKLASKSITILTLAPESECHWRRGVSYTFADLRELPFRDDYFDEVVCLSTLEHVGKDNARIYTGKNAHREDEPDSYLAAARELERVCKPGGLIALSVPYGRFVDYGWYQQFDRGMLDQLLGVFAGEVRVTFFRYAGGGWQISTSDACADCEGFDIHTTRYFDANSSRDYDADFAAASRAIAAIEIRKGGAR